MAQETFNWSLDLVKVAEAVINKLDKNKRIDKTNDILYTGEIAPFGSSDINLSFWIDYESIGNDMMSKVWIGTMKVYGGFKNE